MQDMRKRIRELRATINRDTGNYYTYQAIADKVGCSKQYVSEVINRPYNNQKRLVERLRFETKRDPSFKDWMIKELGL